MPSLLAPLRRFARAERGNMTVEAVILMPILLTTFVGLYSVFDGFRAQTVNQRAAYTVSDMLSRETQFIDDTYIDNAYDLLTFMADTQTTDIKMRVTVISYNEKRDRFSVVWSEVRGTGYTPYRNRDVRDWHDILPIMVDGEQTILVETSILYEPPVGFGLGSKTIDTRVFNRPRFAPQLRYDPDDLGA